MRAIPLPPLRRGRPPTGATRLTAAAILDAAATRLETSGGALSLRALARDLGVDPMALYHYFATKDDLLKALAGSRFAALEATATPSHGADNTLASLQALGLRYVQATAGAPTLTRLLARGQVDSEDVAGRFASLFDAAVAGLKLPKQTRALARDVLVDYLHGFALAGLPVQEKGLKKGIALIHAGLLASRRQPSPPTGQPTAARKA